MGIPDSNSSATIPKPSERPKLTGTVLVVEDEPSIVKLLSAILGGMGLFVLKARNAPEAIDAFSRYPEILAVLTDICMPGMNGLDLASELLALKPGLPTLLLSGFPHEDGDWDNLFGLPNVRFIQKPFCIHKLESTLRVLVAA